MGFFRRIGAFFKGIFRFLREVRAELRKVIWPSRQETFIYTMVVLVAVLFVALLIFVVDYIYAALKGIII